MLLTRIYLISGFLLYMLSFPATIAAQSNVSGITVSMYELNRDSSARILVKKPDGSLVPVPCTFTSQKYGCSWDTTKPYPYDSNPITIPIEGHYLINVVPREMNSEPASVEGSDFHPEAVRAQAIVARTYAWNKIVKGGEIDNSTNNQVFVPGLFDRLDLKVDDARPYREWTPGENPCSEAQFGSLTETQREVCRALRDQLYISAAGANTPAFSEFSADPKIFASGNYKTTEAGGILRSVSDPISQKCFPKPDEKGNIAWGHGRGMTQNGASRWARGDMCTNGRVSNPWSVTYDRAEQILVHYYTGIDIIALGPITRNGSTMFNTNDKVVPPLRWNPLEITGIPRTVTGSSTSATVWVQNTGSVEWKCDAKTSYRLGYAWVIPFDSATITYTYKDICSAGSNTTIAMGSDKKINMTIPTPARQGFYRMYFDVQRMVKESSGSNTYSSFRQQNPAWEPYSRVVCVKSCQKNLPYVAIAPIIQNGGSSSAASFAR